MKAQTIGFIGSGRATAFMIEGLRRKRPELLISVMDANPSVSENLSRTFASVTDCGSNYEAVGNSDVLFIVLHPQNLQAGCEAVAPYIGAGSIVISLAPKAPISSLAAWLGTDRVVRYLPNAATCAGNGYNPVAWGPFMNDSERRDVKALLSALGDVPEIEESDIETYAVLSAMGPTYLWPLLDEMITSGVRYGLGAEESARMVSRMAVACAGMIESSGKDFTTRMNMIPSKPMADIEAELREKFRTKLDEIHAKLTCG